MTEAIEVGWVFDTATTPIINIVPEITSEDKKTEEKPNEKIELTDTYDDFLTWAEKCAK